MFISEVGTNIYILKKIQCRFVSVYENQNQVTDTGAMVDCKTYNKRRPRKEWDKACRFELNNLGTLCIKQQAFGLGDGWPCVLLKLNKVNC